jgi:signal transduction histidine kinase
LTEQAAIHTEACAIPEAGFTRGARTDIGRRAAFVIGYSLLLLAYLWIHPGTKASIRTIDNFAQAIGPWIAAVWVFRGLFRGKETAPPEGFRRVPIVRRWAIFWIGMGSLCYAIGQSIWTFYECVLHQSPQPSLADLFYFGVAPCFMAGILMMPARPIPTASRTRIVLDAVVIMTATITFSWYYLVGPMLLDATTPLIARILGAVYAMQPYLLVYSLLRLSARSRDTVMRPAVTILSVGLVINLVTESVYGYQVLHGTYLTGSPLDTGFPLGMMTMFLGAYAARRIASDQVVPVDAQDDSADYVSSLGSNTPSAGKSLLPYALVPIVWVFALWLSRAEHNQGLMVGVYVGAGILVVLTLLRQAFAFLENASLYHRLHEAYDTLAESNRRAIEHAESMRRINAELKALQNELVQSAKLASLGTLSTGIAHELNQPLAVIRGMVQQLCQDETLPEDAREDLVLVEGQTTRMKKIILHLRTFARVSGDEHRPVDLNRVVNDSFILLGAQLGSAGIEIDMNLAPEDPSVLGDANELEQVLLNLITNARDAMEGRAGAKLTITTRREEDRCLLICQDTGPGIPEDNLGQVFDPFFTTKDPGKGTGLGLSISHSIIRKHHGTIQVENSGGAVFTISLPLLGEDTKDGAHAGLSDLREDAGLIPASLGEAA